MSGSGFTNEASGFQKVCAYGISGSSNTAALTGSLNSANEYYGRSDWGELTAYPCATSTYCVYVKDFASVTVTGGTGDDGYNASGLAYGLTTLAAGHWIFR